jgi:hypothetical protein
MMQNARDRGKSLIRQAHVGLNRVRAPEPLETSEARCRFSGTLNPRDLTIVVNTGDDAPVTS